METVTNILTNPTVRRVAVGGIAAALVALNKKLGLGLDGVDIAGLVSLALGYILQSGLNSKAQILADAQAAAAAASAEVKTPDDAVAVLNAKIAELTAQREGLK
jgi:hypothetical protein